MASWAPVQRVCKTLLQNTFGKLLADEQALELGGSFADGRVEFRNIALHAAALDRLVGNLPIAIAAASVESVTVEVPWSTLLYDSANAKVEIRGLAIELAPRNADDAPSPSPASPLPAASRYAHTARAPLLAPLFPLA